MVGSIDKQTLNEQGCFEGKEGMSSSTSREYIGTFAIEQNGLLGHAGEFNRAVIALRTIVQTEGLVGLFAGYRSFLLRDLPFDAIEFFAYEQLKVTYSKSLKDRRPLNPAETSVIGERFANLISASAPSRREAKAVHFPQAVFLEILLVKLIVLPAE